MKKSDSKRDSGIWAYSEMVFPHLERILELNCEVMERIARQLVRDVQAKKSLFVFGSGHSSILPMELYHRAGGPSFMIPLVADFLLPTAGPPVVRLFERTPGSANVLLSRAQVRPGEMIWIASQSGINGAVVDLALEAKRLKLRTVAFTSLAHSRSVDSRHPSKKKLFEICDEVIDWGGVVGDAVISLTSSVSTGPLSTLSGIFLAHSILTAALMRLERKGVSCTYTSVNTPQGEQRNQKLEEIAKIRDPLLR
jgi:uncharacterized phosphosugar-binding protein